MISFRKYKQEKSDAENGWKRAKNGVREVEGAENWANSRFAQLVCQPGNGQFEEDPRMWRSFT